MAGVEGFSSCSVGIMSVQSGTSSSGSAGSMASNDISLSMSFESVVGQESLFQGCGRCKAWFSPRAYPLQ